MILWLRRVRLAALKGRHALRSDGPPLAEFWIAANRRLLARVDALTDRRAMVLRDGGAVVFAPWAFVLAGLPADRLRRLDVALSFFASAVFEALARNDGGDLLGREARHLLQVVEEVVDMAPGSLVGLAQPAAGVFDDHEGGGAGRAGGDRESETGDRDVLQDPERDGLRLGESDDGLGGRSLGHADVSLVLTRSEQDALRSIARKLAGVTTP